MMPSARLDRGDAIRRPRKSPQLRLRFFGFGGVAFGCLPARTAGCRFAAGLRGAGFFVAFPFFEEPPLPLVGRLA
jgi:hypothetical protein